MSKDSRVSKSIKNARVNLICYFVTLIVSFFTRKILIDNLGVDFLGLSGTLSSLLSFLNLAELGIGSAISYVLYKPLADSDKFKVNEVVSVLGFLYKCIGYFIAVVGIILSLFLPLIFDDTPFSLEVIYFGFYAYLASSAIGYIVNYKSVLLAADQRNYIVTAYYQVSTVLKVLVQMLLAVLLKNFHVYFAIELIFATFNSVILNLRINSTYPWLKTEIKQGRRLLKQYPEIARYIKQLFFHQVGSFAQGQLAPFLIYSFVNLTVVGLYGNYNLVIKRIESLIKGVLDSTAAGVGNLIASSNAIHIYDTFKELLSIRVFVSGVLSCCIFYLINPFIEVWLGHEYVMDNTVALLMAISFFVSLCRNVISQFATGFGLFYDVWAPIVETVIFVLVAVIGGYFYGITGILSASIVSIFLICYVWRAYFLYTKGFKESVWKFWMLFISHTISILIAYFIARFVTSMVVEYDIVGDTWKNWIVSSCIFTSTISLASAFLFYINSSGFRMFVNRFIKLKL